MALAIVGMLSLLVPVASAADRAVPPDHVVVLEGSGHDDVRDIVGYPGGGVIAVGGTQSPDFPLTFTEYAGDVDAFIVRLDADGEIVWARVIGGPHHDRAYAVEIDPAGDIIVGGRAGRDFPVTQGALQTKFSGGSPKGPYQPQDGFFAKFTPDGEIIYASYFGAVDPPGRIIRDLAVGASGDIWLAASTATGRYPEPIRAAFGKTLRQGMEQAVVARIAGDGSSIRWARAFGGEGEVWGVPSIRIAAGDDAVYLTNGSSPRMPVTRGVVSPKGVGDIDLHVSRWAPDGSLKWGTYLASTGLDQIETHHLAIAADDSIVIAAGADGEDFPTTPGAFDRTHNGVGGIGAGLRTNYPGDVVVVRLSPDGRELIGSTLFGGSDGEAAEGVIVDRSGNIIVSGTTFSADIPRVNAIAPPTANRYDAFIAAFSPDLKQLLFSSHLGPRKGSVLRCATIDSSGRIWFGGNLRAPGDWAAAGIPAKRGRTTADALIVRYLPPGYAPPE